MQKKAFGPAGPTVTLAVAVTTGRIPLPNRTVRVHNAGTATVFLAFGDVTVTATLANGMPLPAGSTEVFTVHDGTHIAAIGTVAGNLYVTPGEGL